MVTITAAADGSALGNPGPAGWAWYVDDEHWAAGGWPHATNNRGELQAVLELFRATAHLDDDLHVLCDSMYAINCITRWMPGWKAKGWRKGDGKPVLNVDLLEQLDEVIRGRRYRFEWVKGHAGHDLNEAADVRARAAAAAYQSGGEPPAGPGWAGESAAVSAPAPAPRSAPEPTPVVAPEAAPVSPAAAAALFELDDDPETDAAVELTLLLSPDEHDRLRRRARDADATPADFLRGLI